MQGEVLYNVNDYNQTNKNKIIKGTDKPEFKTNLLFNIKPKDIIIFVQAEWYMVNTHLGRVFKMWRFFKIINHKVHVDKYAHGFLATLRLETFQKRFWKSVLHVYYANSVFEKSWKETQIVILGVGITCFSV